MADSGVREIQLTGKQLVFLFMASVVLIVSVFLLGVSVGRGVHGAQAISGVAEAAPATTTEPPVPVPVNTPGATAGTTYQTALAAGGAQATTPPQSPPAPQASSTPAPKSNPAPPPALTPPPPSAIPATSAPASNTAAKTTTQAKPPAPATGAWFVQIESFKSKDSADALAAKLRAKGYAVSIVDAKPLFKVRVGPYAQRSDTDTVVEKMKKDGFSSAFVTR
jgi:cell division protein FtsN